MSANKKKVLIKILIFFGTFFIAFSFCETAVRHMERKQCEIDTCVYLQQAHISLHRISKIPGLGYELIPNATSADVFFSINSRGVRDKEYSIPKPKDVFRVIVLGDSVTFAAEYPLDQTYPKILENLLNLTISGTLKFEVLNAGVSAYNALQKLIFFKERLLAYQPDLVIFQFINDDYYRNAVILPDALNREKGHTCISLGEYFTLNFPALMPLPVSLDRFLMRHSAFYRLVNLRIYDILSGYFPRKYPPYAYRFAGYKNISESMEANKNIFGEFAELSRRHNFRFVLLLVPTLKNEDDMDPWIRNDCPQLFGFDVIDLFKIFKQKNVDLSSLRIEPNGTCHLNKQGHEFTAKIIFDYLKDFLAASRDFN